MVAWYSLHHPDVEGLSPAAAAGTGKEALVKSFKVLINRGSIVVQHFPKHSNATDGTVRKKMVNRFNNTDLRFVERNHAGWTCKSC